MWWEKHSYPPQTSEKQIKENRMKKTKSHPWNMQLSGKRNTGLVAFAAARVGRGSRESIDDRSNAYGRSYEFDGVGLVHGKGGVQNGRSAR